MQIFKLLLLRKSSIFAEIQWIKRDNKSFGWCNKLPVRVVKLKRRLSIIKNEENLIKKTRMRFFVLMLGLMKFLAKQFLS